MKHPDFYNVVISSNEGDYGLTQEDENEVRIIVTLPGEEDWQKAVVDITIPELVELLSKRGKP